MKKIIVILLILTFLLPVQKSYGKEDYTRIYGNNRIETAIKISESIQKESKVVILANSTQYIDALAGSTLANLYEAPILLVENNKIPKETLTEMNRLGVEKVYLLGGLKVISKDLENSLANYEVKRIAGKDRYETSYEIYKEILKTKNVGTVLVAAQEADAIASSALRGDSIPLLLISESNLDFIKDINAEKIVLGGNRSLSENTFKIIGASKRIYGENRFETAVLLAKESKKTNTIIVNGYNLVDAFTSGTIAFRNNANILLTETFILPKETKDYLEKENTGTLTLIGGQKSISDLIFNKEDSTNSTSITYWDKYNNYGKNILLDNSQIEKYNKTIDNGSNRVQNILEISDKFSKSWILEAINNLKMPSNPTKQDGSAYSAQERNIWLSNRAIEYVGDTTATYAFAVQRTLIRTFPTNDGNIKNGYYDYFAEDAVNPWEKLMILHSSRDNNWYFVLTENYSGWVQAKDIAITTKDEMIKYENMNFCVVTEPKIELNGYNMDMGTRVPMKEDKILLPGKDRNSLLTVTEFPKANSLNFGYLPYTEYNLVKQALKFEGEPYGWGGSRNAHDCSSFIEDIHKVFGIKLPRNTSDQEPVNLAGKISLVGMNKENKRKTILNSGPASVIYMDGHVVFYLGKNEKGEEQIIHQFAHYYQNGYKTVNACKITSLDLKNAASGTYLDLYKTIQKYR